MNTDGDSPAPLCVRRMITDAQRNGRVITVPLPMRWVAYKPSSQQAKHGIKGRWQVCDDYGWKNADFTPLEFFDHVEGA